MTANRIAFGVMLFCGALVAAATSSAPSPERFAAEIRRFSESDGAAPPAPCQLLFTGSSSIVKWTTLATDMAPVPALNRGFGGSHISDVNHYFAEVVVPYHPRAIVFYAGENDIAAGKAPAQVVADFDAFMDRKSAALGNVPVYFISLKPSKLRVAQLEQQREVNEVVRARAQARTDLHYIDVVSLMLEDGQPKSLFVADNLHMSAEGYALWTAAVRSAVMPDTEKDERQCQRTLRPQATVSM